MSTLVLVTGSRTWSDRSVVQAVLTDIFDARGAFTLMHGHDKRGVDAMADEWTVDHEYLGVTPDRYPVTAWDWQTQGLKAGILRNERMVGKIVEARETGVHVECVGFLVPCAKPDCRRPGIHPTHGAHHCATLAADVGIPTTTYTEGDFG